MVEIDWNVETTRVVCQLFAEQKRRGNRPNTCLNSVGYAEVQKGLQDRLGIEANKTQIKNKWDKLKEDLRVWKKLMLRQTGTGWCPVKGTIVMDDEWWNKAKKEIPGCGKFRKLGLQNVEELEVCFGSIINIGADHWSPHMTTEGQTQENANNDDNEMQNGAADDDDGGPNEVEELSPINANGKRPPRIVDDKGKKPKTGTALLIQEAVTSMAASANAFASKKEGKFSIEEVMKKVIACGAGYGTNEHFIASELFVKKEQREMFMTLPSDEIKFNWLTRKYVAKYGN